MYTPVPLRRLIVSKYKEGWKQKRISMELHVPKSTVFDIIQRYRLTGEMGTHRDRCRGHRILSARDDRLLKRASDANPLATARQLQATVGGRIAQVSISTVKRSLRVSGRVAYRPVKAPALTPSQMAVRLHWAQAHQFWTVRQWQRVIFSDESAFDVCPARSKFVRRSPAAPIKAVHTAQHRPYLQRVMVWGCFCYSGPGPIVAIAGTMRQANYLSTLQEHLFPQIAQWYGTRPCVFQQDNAPCHKARKVAEFLEKQRFSVLEWPPYSPDLSPIENLWAIVKQKVHLQPVKTKEELLSRIKAIWKDDPAVKAACQTLIESMPRRIQACIDAKGGRTKY